MATLSFITRAMARAGLNSVEKKSGGLFYYSGNRSLFVVEDPKYLGHYLLRLWQEGEFYGHADSVTRAITFLVGNARGINLTRPEHKQYLITVRNTANRWGKVITEARVYERSQTLPIYNFATSDLMVRTLATEFILSPVIYGTPNGPELPLICDHLADFHGFPTL